MQVKLGSATATVRADRILCDALLTNIAAAADCQAEKGLHP